MCDDYSLDAPPAGMSRRGFGIGGAAATLAVCSASATGAASGLALAESRVSVPTADGQCDAFFVHPAKGRHPGIILWPDIAGLRPAFEVLARKLAAEGFAVLAVNHYYRGGKAPIMATFAEWRTPEGQAKTRPLMAQINPATIAADARAYVAWLDAQPSVDRKRRVGTYGHCMTGSYTIRAAAAVPGRIGAAASMHGGGLVGTAADSPDKLIAATHARYLFAIARNDDARAPGDKDALKAALSATDRQGQVEVYAADHGWTVPDSPVYDRAEAERAFTHMVALFKTL